jgi:hypothetical protein
VPDRNGGHITVPGVPWHFSPDNKHDTAPRSPAYRGEHNEQVLRELGYTSDEIETLWKRGALIQGDTTPAAETPPAPEATGAEPQQPEQRGSRGGGDGNRYGG